MPQLQRMKDEHKQLGINIGKLGVFTSPTNSEFMSLPIAERDGMLTQLFSMEGHYHYLGQRIERATNNTGLLVEAKPQDGSTVKGYRKLSDVDVAEMNSLKEVSKKFIDTLNRLEATGRYDIRWLRIAKTDMQTACMAACRSVAQPSDES